MLNFLVLLFKLTLKNNISKHDNQLTFNNALFFINNIFFIKGLNNNL